MVESGADKDYASAVEEAKRRYPRIASLPIILTYNPKRDSNSETFQPNTDENPQPKYWNIEMGREPYAPAKESWPELVALESLHALQETDPTYRKMTEGIVKSYTPEQMVRAHRAFRRDLMSGGVPNDFDRYLRRVDAPELIRGRLWGDYFRRYESKYKNEYNTYRGYTPQQVRMLDDLQSYLQSKD